jgi:hypothetical protein
MRATTARHAQGASRTDRHHGSRRPGRRVGLVQVVGPGAVGLRPAPLQAGPSASDPNDYGSVFQQWQNAVQEASNFYTFAGRRSLPWQVLDIVSGSGNGGPKPSPLTSRRTSTSPRLRTPMRPRSSSSRPSWVETPTEGELDRYASMMTAYAQKHPKITKRPVTDVHGNNTVTQLGWRTDGGLGTCPEQSGEGRPGVRQLSGCHHLLERPDGRHGWKRQWLTRSASTRRSWATRATRQGRPPWLRTSPWVAPSRATRSQTCAARTQLHGLQ